MNAASWAPKQEAPDAKQLLLSSMRFGLQSRDMIEDLKVRFVENKTPGEFVLGDDPAVMLNRFVHDKLGDGNFGVASAGLIIVMPLTPRLSIIAYDGQVYTLNLTDGRLILTKSAEVDAFNEIQMLAALENLYFHYRTRANTCARSFSPCGIDGSRTQLAKFFYNRTGIGHVRKAEWLKRGGMPIPRKRSSSARKKPILIRTQ